MQYNFVVISMHDVCADAKPRIFFRYRTVANRTSAYQNVHFKVLVPYLWILTYTTNVSFDLKCKLHLFILNSNVNVVMYELL